MKKSYLVLPFVLLLLITSCQKNSDLTKTQTDSLSDVATQKAADIQTLDVLETNLPVVNVDLSDPFGI